MKRLFVILMIIGFIGTWQFSEAAMINQNKGNVRLEQKSRSHKKKQQQPKKQKVKKQDSQKNTENTENTDNQKK